MMKTAQSMIIADRHLGNCGRIFGSKTGYSERHPDNFVVFNANVCTEKDKIWYGDLDLTREEEDLKSLAGELNQTIYVLYESDARFANENSPLLSRHCLKISPEGVSEIGPLHQEYFTKINGKIQYKKFYR